MPRQTKYEGESAPLAPLFGLAGLGFAALIVAGNLILIPAGLPRPGAAIGDVLAFFANSKGALGLASALTPFAWVLSALFGAGAVQVLWRSERDRGGAWALAGFAGVLLQNAAFTGVVALRLALAATPDSSAALGLWALHNALFTLNGTFLALALTGLSLGGLQAGLIPRWHCRLGLSSAALLFGSATLTPWIIDRPGPLGLLGLVGWLLWVVWIAVYSLTLARRPAAPAPC
ncbi:hypothetical protein [Nannocystis radixulma]|uniref:DUF4386 family protein n=1 Tax=Nannocystis radixulma TaxID=2995305 RepID=A0ABT5B3Z7_9BACT|nr:hypothetical protein [Nannocystis radixulma]MDC0668198.1 hypothetical protein [Nannocystis radixulma]